MTVAIRRKRKRKLKAEINVVPYIDVMLVLLIIFMVTAPLLNLGVDIQLPQSNAKSIQEKKDPVIVSVDREGHLFLTIEGAKNQAVSSAEMVTKVGAYVRNNPKVAVFVAGDGNAPYQTIYTVLTDLQTKANVPRAGLMSNPTEAPAK
ncbi:ExbD/TolR family protein [Luteimonas gilva]|uniref:Tol-Pal system protein TolR n=1 Tax=Luteimonas gilva TaxID=2572684 RepID=A0A4U5JY85_9GAMM|nr:ExbD/TolR family protein [Luteimonas gilva]TKR34146.1 ExbD/TolR family protein [Luteimonas gilva]